MNINVSARVHRAVFGSVYKEAIHRCCSNFTFLFSVTSAILSCVEGQVTLSYAGLRYQATNLAIYAKRSRVTNRQIREDRLNRSRSNRFSKKRGISLGLEPVVGRCRFSQMSSIF